jgi:DNA end-binding protein Ku
MLHAADKSPVSFSRVCAREGRPVAWKDLVKGYEYAKGHFVVMTKEDFQAAAVEKTRRVDILDFVKADEIDDRFFETPYYLVPEKSGEHAYALLREALRDTDRIGIAKFVLRDTLHLAAIEVIDDALVLTLMRFADELVDAKPFALPVIKDIRKPELEMAKALVEGLAADWDPSKYTDEYRDNLMRLIQGKVKGKKVDLETGEQSRPAHVVDLMERLRRSLESRGVKTGAGGKGQHRSHSRPATKASSGKPASRKRARRAA